MAVVFPEKASYTLADLEEIVRILRSPEGCPWDREQTHQTLRSGFLEETHEALDAISRNDIPGMREELGDVLLQVVFHSDIEREQGSFTMDDVITDICRKLIVRHPHVFGNVVAADSDQVPSLCTECPSPPRVTVASPARTRTVVPLSLKAASPARM